MRENPAKRGHKVIWADLAISGGTIPKNHESIIEPLMELRIDHRDIEVL